MIKASLSFLNFNFAATSSTLFNPKVCQNDKTTLKLPCHGNSTPSVYKKYNRLVLRLLQSFMCYVFGYRHGILVSSSVVTLCTQFFSNFFLPSSSVQHNFSRWFSILQIERKTFFQIMKMLWNIKFNIPPQTRFFCSLSELEIFLLLRNELKHNFKWTRTPRW